jgi:hypothetical protein
MTGVRFFNPGTLPEPGSRSGQRALVTDATRRLKIAGQVVAGLDAPAFPCGADAVAMG